MVNIIDGHVCMYMYISRVLLFLVPTRTLYFFRCDFSIHMCA